MDTTELEAAYHALLEAAAAPRRSAASEKEWDADRVLAHVAASSRMLAAASAELLSGRIPVVDNRPTQSRPYLDAIVNSAAGRAELLATVERCGRELLTLAAQLSADQAATTTPTIIEDGGRIRIQRPVAFSSLLAPDHVREHVDQLRALT
ncbi:MAG: hypothetical protein ACLQNG_03375 [Acidimicrobiales bacterium]